MNDTYRRLLHDQIISENSPGTILADFKMLLDFVGKDGILVTGKNKLFPMNLLNEINRRLSNPLQINLARPLQKSYPNINGLYLLMRCSGLVREKRAGKKSLLVVDDQTYKNWCALNPTEKYFSLLEVWILRLSDDVLDEQSAQFSNMPPFFAILKFIRSIPKSGLQISKEANNDDKIRYSIGFHHLALLHLFGLVNIQSGINLTNNGWNVKSANHTEFGDALLNVLSDSINRDESIFTDYRLRLNIENPPDSFLPVVQPYFPEFEKILTVSEAEFKDGEYIFVIFLDTVWCRIAILANMTFDTLSNAILKAYGFDYDHSYSFTYRNIFGAESHINDPNMEEGEFASEVEIGSISLVAGDTVIYVFDFGDHWEFKLTLESIEPSYQKIGHPRIIEMHGEPPEQYPVWADE